MAEQKRRRRSSKKDSPSGDGAGASDVAEATKDVGEETTGRAQEAGEEVTGQAQEAGEDVRDFASGETRTVTSELRSVVREAAIEALSPVARKATTSAAKYALTKGPGLVTDRVVPKVTETVKPRVEEAGGPLELAKKAGGGAGGLLSKLGKGATPSGTGRGRRLPVQESIDVAVPLETAYNQFTQFEDLPEFMHRVERVEQKDDAHLMWHENIWGVRRQWEAEITDQQPNERIAWESTSGSPKQRGVVTFHELSDRLTRVEVTLDQQPKGIFEKTSSGFRMTRRALRSDLMRFKAFIETRDEETGAWRGEIEEGEVVGEEEEERSEAEEEEARAETSKPSRRRRPRREKEQEEEETEEPELEVEEEEEEEEPEEGAPEEEEKPRKRKPARRRAAARRRSPAGRSRR